MKLAPLVATLALAATGAAPAPPARARTEPAPVTAPGDMAVGRGSVRLVTGELGYTTRAGLLPILDNDTGAVVAHVFVVAYVADRAPGSTPRPLTFLWNGGPGSSASQVHLVGFGPKGFRTPATYPEWKAPPSQLEDRPETWLAASDLVFVDPVGTGYSRAVSEAARDKLYTQHGDAEAVAEAIRVYRTRYTALDQPLFLAGESYGTTRAEEVAAALAYRRTPVTGVVLISGEFDPGARLSLVEAAAMQVPLYTATAHFHRRLPPELQALSRDEAVRRASAWARSRYAPALERREALTPPERAALLAELQRFTGIDPKWADATRLTLAKERFTDHLLDDRGLELGRYDARMTLPQRPEGAGGWLPTQDPSLLPMLGIMQGTSAPMVRYLRETLGFRSDLLYRGPFGGAFHPQTYRAMPGGLGDDWMAAMWEHGAVSRGAAARPPAPEGPPPTAPLRRAMDAQPGLRVMNVRGLYDTSCAALDLLVERLEPAVRARVRNRCYPAGHMVYTDRDVRLALQRDFADFVREAASAR